MRISISNSRRGQRGMTLAEALIAVLVFSIVFLAALMLYNTANRAYLATDAATIQQQNARFAMDRLMNTLRNAGAGYNVTGSNTIPDEQIEDADSAAVFVRGDFDNARENGTPNLENAAHPYVSVGNDEIVGYILRKPGGDTVNTVNITMHFDTTTDSGGRDATLAGTTPSNEEDVIVRAAAQSLADETNPPYQLTRVTFNDSGVPQYEVIADNIFRLSFGYTKKDATALAAASMGGDDAQRADRALIRKIDVSLVTMANRPDFRYTDPNTYTPAETTLTKKFRKFNLAEFVAAPNLGVKGSRHSPTPAITIDPPASITVCTGHDRNFYVYWTPTTTAGITDYQVHVTGTGTDYPDNQLAIGTNSLRYTQPEATIQALTFTVAGISGPYTGTYSTAVTKTSTHEGTSVPAAPVNIITGGVTGQNAMSVTWNGVTTSTSAINTATCTTQPGSITSVPPASWGGAAPDLQEYHVYRKILTPTNGVTGAFDVNGANPTAGNRIDNYTLGGFADTTPTTNAFTDKSAAPCGRYFYKIVGYDSGGFPTALTSSSGSAAMANAAFYIPPGGITPQVPTKPGPVGGTLASPSGSPPSWSVLLTWPWDVRDSTGEPALTTHYQIVREHDTGSSGNWTSDGAPLDVYETNQMTTPDILNANAAYRYKLRAIYDCSAVGDTDRVAESDWYVLSCTFTPAVAATGTTIGDGSQNNPWELDYPDYVEVTAPSGSTIQRVDFTLKEDSSGDTITQTSQTTAPFRFGYANQQDGTIYRLEMTATSTAGCTYSAVKYIRDAPPVPACLLGTSTRTGPTLTLDQTGTNCASTTPGGALGKKGANKTGTATWKYTIPNSSSIDDLTLKQIRVEWARDVTHGDATLTAITFPAASGTVSITTTSSNNTPAFTGLFNVPPTARLVGANTTTYQIQIKYTYNACDLDMTAAPITGICLVYTSPNTGTQSRFCNLVGTTANNPSSCD
jgi:Tfp pilus assembly protein PilW